MANDIDREQEYRELGYNVHLFEEYVRSIDGEEEREYLRSLQTGFFNRNAYPSSRYVPRLLLNDKEASTDVLSALKYEFSCCERFDIAVAFVTGSGVTILIETLLDLERRNVPGRVLVSTYLSFNQPDALARLRNFSNIELRIYEGSLHSKGYLFESNDLCTLIIGSSNLTQEALRRNYEWNLMIKTYKQGSISAAASMEFEHLWTSINTKQVNEEWLARYRDRWHRLAIRRSYRTHENAETLEYATSTAEKAGIEPNKMQIEALANLKRLRDLGKTRALLISATGTGKTYLAAFDVAEVNPSRMLFIVHRERIAKDAKDSFEKIVDSNKNLGLCAGNVHDYDADYLFCTIQSLAGHLDKFDPQRFDYIVFDEAHHIGASRHQRVATYFKPRFMLGMTATPMRNDDFNVYDFFDNNIAYQITLQRAQEANMLAPFHYFGIHDLLVDGEEIDDFSDFSKLTSDARVNHVLNQIERYCVHSTRRGLVFCSGTDEAYELAALFNERGYRSKALDGSSTDRQREVAIERLECDRSKRDDWIEFIFTVDIFNEGMDIPSVNLVIMLRPTKSAIIFVQQLGRGLRLHEGKDYVLVLDFIGNYDTSYLIPIALSGDRTYNKDNLRRYIQEGNKFMPGCSTISFDGVAKERIYSLIEKANFNKVEFIKKEYKSLKKMLGRIPSLIDFHDNGAIDPQLIFSNTNLGSYHMFLKKHDREYKFRFTETQEQMLRFVSQKLGAGKRVQDLLLLKLLLSESRVSEERFAEAVHEVSPTLPVAACSVRSMLSGTFLSGGQAKTFALSKFIADEDGDFEVSDLLATALEDGEFRRQLEEIVDYGLFVNGKRFVNNYDHTSLVLYEKYTYEDVCWLLEWGRNLSSVINGYFYDEKTNTFPVFINYNKSDEISDTTKYQDRFKNPSRLIAISKSGQKADSKDIVRLKSADAIGMRIFLFMRKHKGKKELKEFYYLGEMRPTGKFEQIIMAGTNKSAVEIEYDLLTPVKDELYDYLTSGEG